MAGFDPDAYLAQKEAPQGFDPDAYLKEKDTTAQATFDPDSYLRGKDAPLLTEDPAGYALAGLHDKTRREEAYQAYQAKHRQPTTITSAGNAALDFAKGAIPMKREDGTWHWPLGGAAVSMAKGGYDTLKNISKAGGLDTPTGAIFGPLAGAVKSAFDEDPERLKAGRQLGAGAELGVIEAGHQLVSAGRNISGLASAATGGHVGTMEKDISDEEMRRRFKEEIAYRYLTQGMGQGHYAEELAGHPTAMITPEELAAKGAPINPEEIGGIASTTSPMNLAEIGALTNPITGKVMAPLLKGVAGVGEKTAGAIATGAENLAKSKLAHAVTVPALIADLALTGGAHTAAAATAAGAGAATWAGAKLAQGALGAAREAGEEMLGAAPSVGQGFFRKTIKEGIKGATGAIPVAGVFSLGGDNAESAGDTFWSVLGLGAAGGAISGAKNARLIDAQAQFARMAKSGSTVNYGDATDQAHRSIVSQLSPEAASIINFWRGSFDGATTPDGKPIRVQAVDDATFQKMTGQSSRGAYFTDGRLIVNAGHFENGTFIPQTAAQLAEVFAHEGKHSIDEATKAAQPELYKSVFDSLKKRFTDADGKATPDFLQWIQGQMQLHLNNLAEAGATPSEIDAKMSRLGDLGYWLNEASADIGQGLITGAPMGTFQLSQPMIAKVWDAVKDAAASKGVILPSKGDATTGALDLPSAQEAAREIRRQLYAQGKETNARQSAKESKGKTIGDRISELTPIAARPITAATSMDERKETRDAQREIAELQKDIGAAAPIPSSGPPPTAPSKPAVIISLDATTKDALAALDTMGIRGARANSLIRQANTHHGTPIGDAAKLAAGAFRIHGGGAVKPGEFVAKPPVPVTPIPIPVGEKSKFKDETGTERIVTGLSPDAPRVGDIVATRDGEIRRVTRALGDTVDTARPIDPLNARGTKTHKATDVQPLTHDYAQTPAPVTGTATADPEPAKPAMSVVPASGSRFKIVDAAGQNVNRTTYATEGAANQAIGRIGQKSTFGLPPSANGNDIIDAIIEHGGINLSGLSKDEAEQSFPHKGSWRNALTSKNPDNTPDEIARNLASDGHGDGHVEQMWQKITEAIDARNSLRDQQAAEEKRQKAEGKAAKNLPNEPAPTESTRPDDLPPEPTRTATIPERPVDAPEPVTLSPADVDQIAAEAETAVRAARTARHKPATLPKAITDAQVDAVAAAHAEGLPANYQGVRQRTDALGKTTISGTFNPERPFDAFLLKLADISKPATDILLNLQSKIGQTVTLNYGHAPETEGKVTAESRKAAQKASSAQARASGEADTQAEDKNYIPLEFRFNKGSDTPSITVIGASPEKLLSNFNHAAAAVTELGGEVPYRDIHDPHYVMDLKQLAINHRNGYTYDGRRIEGFPDVTIPTADEGFVPHNIPQDRFEFLNLTLGDESAKTGKKGVSPEQKLKQGLAAKNHIPMADAGEVNILRESINRAKGEVLGKDGQPTTWSKATIENPLSEALRVDLINEIKPELSNEDASIRPHGYVGDIGRFFAEGSPNRTFTSAGFMPSEHRIPGLDDAAPEQRVSIPGLDRDRAKDAARKRIEARK